VLLELQANIGDEGKLLFYLLDDDTLGLQLRPPCALCCWSCGQTLAMKASYLFSELLM
jgi:hypothetical protein